MSVEVMSKSYLSAIGKMVYYAVSAQNGVRKSELCLILEFLALKMLEISSYV